MRDAASAREKAEAELVRAYDEWAYGSSDGRSSRSALVRAAISLAVALKTEKDDDA